jgi:Secretion system C-terminal sorting domain
MKTYTIKSQTMKTLLFILLFITGFAYAQPNINTNPTPLAVCDTDDNGFEVFNLISKNFEIFNNLDETNLTLNYYVTLVNAQNATNPIVNPTNYTNITASTQTVYARVTNTVTNTFSIATLNLICNPPIVLGAIPDLIVYENPADGAAVFHLIDHTAAIVGGAPLTVPAFYNTQMDAELQINPIVNLTAYNGTDQELIWVKIQNLYTGCSIVSSFKLRVVDSSIILTFPDTNLKAALVNSSPTTQTALGSGGYVAVDTNGDGEIQVGEAIVITGLQFQGSGIIDFTGIQGFPNITYFGCYNNPIGVLNLNGFTQLTNINITYSQGTQTVYNLFNLPALTNFNYTYSNVTSITLTNTNSVTDVGVWGNPSLTTLNLIELTGLLRIKADGCSINNFSATNSPILNELNLGGSDLTSIAITTYPALKKLTLEGNQLTDVSDFSNLLALEELNIQNNQITNLQLPPMPALRSLIAGSNGYPTIDLSGYPQLRVLAANNNTLTTIDFSNNPLLQQLIISQNAIATADFSMLSNLTSTTLGGNLFTEIDLSGSPLLNGIAFFDNPNLTHVNLKSGTVSSINYSNSAYYNLPNLDYVCVDEGDVFTYNTAQLPNLVVTSYCSFTPGGDYNTITGTATLDANGDGCDSLDILVPFLGLNISMNGISTNSSVYTNSLGLYTIYTNTVGVYQLSPNLEIPAYFNVSPAEAIITTIDNSTTTANICLTPNGSNSDVEVVLAPITPARPGFNATYELVYKNKGNTTLSGSVTFEYDDTILDYISSSQTPASQNTGTISWDYSNLQPFENRSISLVLNVNSPVETPAVNLGDVLNFNTSISPVVEDALPNDNTFAFNQVVIGSYDPNDITCLQGDLVAPSEIGNYLHYVVNFENIGNFYAENVVVKTIVDTSKYDITSLQILNSSHNMTTRIVDNKVEFIFEGINLDAVGGNPPVGGHGNVLFKIKSKSDLVTGDQVTKMSNIYFDYNAPITTNDAQTTYASLSNTIVELDDSFTLYPNPSQSIVNIKSAHTIESVELYDVQGRILEKRFENSDTVIIDLSNRDNGIYFLKITSEKGSKVEKVVKN